VHDLMTRRKNNAEDDQILQADVLAFHGKYADAAKLYKKLNQEHRALTMYTDLRMFDLANEYLTSADSADRKAVFRSLFLAARMWIREIFTNPDSGLLTLKTGPKVENI
jgi:hypothetical protein